MTFVFKSRDLSPQDERHLDFLANEIGKENKTIYANFFTYTFLDSQTIQFESRYGDMAGYELIGWDPDNRYYIIFHLDPSTGKISTYVPKGIHVTGPLTVSDGLKRKIIHFLNTIIIDTNNNSAARSKARTSEIKDELIETALADPHRAWGTDVGAEAIVGMPGITTTRLPGSFNTEEEALAAAYANLNRKSKSKSRGGRRSLRSGRKSHRRKSHRRKSTNGKNRK
jgi:hypothetical protein